MLAPLGSNIKGHQAWFQLPGGFTLQPSELAKFGIIVALAGYCNQYRGELDAWRITTILALAAVPIGLVFLQPDLGTVLVLVVIIVGLLAVAGLTGRQLLVLVLLAITGVYAVVNLGILKDVPDRPVHVVRRSGQRELAGQRVQPGAVEAGDRARPVRGRGSRRTARRPRAGSFPSSTPTSSSRRWGRSSGSSARSCCSGSSRS